MNFEEELRAMANQPKGNWFRPEAKNYTIKVLREPDEDDFYEREFKSGKKEQVNLIISVEGEERTWSVSKGQTLDSLWGHLSIFAHYCNGGKLSGKEFTLIVTGEGMQRKYNIPEALPFIAKAQKELKKQVVKEEIVTPPKEGMGGL